MHHHLIRLTTVPLLRLSSCFPREPRLSRQVRRRERPPQPALIRCRVQLHQGVGCTHVGAAVGAIFQPPEDHHQYVALPFSSVSQRATGLCFDESCERILSGSLDRQVTMCRVYSVLCHCLAGQDLRCAGLLGRAQLQVLVPRAQPRALGSHSEAVCRLFMRDSPTIRISLLAPLTATCACTIAGSQTRSAQRRFVQPRNM